MSDTATHELMDTQAIADMLGVTRRHVTERLTKQPDFPRPAVDRSRKLRRWLREHVERWAQQG